MVVYKAQLDAKKQPARDAHGDYVLGDIVNYSGMESRSEWGSDIPKLMRNGTWNYAIFTADKSPRADINQAVCLACHLPAAASNYVFTAKKVEEFARSH